MKKAILGLMLCLSLAVFTFAGGFSIKVNGGANLLMGGDYNKAVQGYNDYEHSLSNLVISSDLEKLTMGWNFGAEFIYNVTDQIGIGLGAGYFTASNESTYSSVWLSVITISDRWAPSITAIPVTLNFHYFLPVSDAMNVHFTAGPGLYFCNMKFEQQIDTNFLAIHLTTNYEPEGVMAFGFQGGLGIEFALSPGISLCLDVLGRMASFSGLNGPWTQTGTALGWPVSDNGTGTLYYYEDDGYGKLSIGTTLPSGSGITNAREASISLSGVVAQFGIKINI